MVGEGLVPSDDLAQDSGVPHVRVSADLVLGDPRVAAAGRAGNVEETVAGIVRVERHGQKSLLVARGNRHGDEGRGEDIAGGQLDDLYPSGVLFTHEHAGCVAWGRG